MGKSNKKIKNDRINNIRKQYDAFLEEDKKRRERNEYILGKLDKMRTSTALMPISTKVNYNEQSNTSQSEIFMGSKYLRTKPDVRHSYVSHLERQTLTSDILQRPLDELSILKEISKNYILIPKRKTIDNDYVYTKNKDIIDDDWKSKYNILDDLKKLEKEDQTDSVFNQYNDSNNRNNKIDLNMDSQLPGKQLSNLEHHLDNPTFDKNNELIVSKPNEIPEERNQVKRQINVPRNNNQDNENGDRPLQITSTNKIKNVDQTKCAQNDSKDSIVNPQKENFIEKEKFNTESNEKDVNLIQNFNINPQMIETNIINHSTLHPDNVIQSDLQSVAGQDKYDVPENVKPDINNVSIFDQRTSHIKSQELDAVEYSEDTLHMDHSIDNQKDARVLQDSASSETVELHDNITNNPDGQIPSNEITLDNPHHYDSSQDVIPVDIENTPHLNHAENESEINAFEAEQKEMFYSEQTHPDTYEYNQAEGNTGEYTESYDHNNQYAYYEGVQEEQGYATNINEHEESTERYDPHYNQQYEGSFVNQQPDNTIDYENANIYEQQQFHDENQQLENVVKYDSPQVNEHIYEQEHVSNEKVIQETVLSPEDNQMYDQHLYAEHPTTQEQIEQQLATEEGYIESTAILDDRYQNENEDEIEQVTNTTTEESTPDTKLV